MGISEVLKELRKEKGLTLKQTAEGLQLTSSAYANYEYGIRQPSIEIIKRMCEFFDVSADYLIGLEK